MNASKALAIARALATTAVLLVSGSGRIWAQDAATKGESAVVVTASKFYCNVHALNASERARHEELTRKLLKARKDTVEWEKGYEFQFTPNDVSISELAEWVVAESKCCPFFDFHIDLENEGKLVCLRLTGAEGVKAFIRSEFGLGKG